MTDYVKVGLPQNKDTKYVVNNVKLHKLMIDMNIYTP